MLPSLPRAFASLACLVLAALLSGCVAPPMAEVTEVKQVKVPVRVPVPVPVNVIEPSDAVARQFLAYHERVRLMTQPELQQEVVRIGDPAASAVATMELCTVLGYTRTPTDVQRAIGLLDNLLKSTTAEAAPWQPWARLLRSRYAEQRRIEEQLDKQNQQTRDTQRKLEQVTQQLEALKAIERTLTPRPPPAASEARPPQ